MQILKTLKWLFILILFWISYLLFTILSFPIGTLSDKADAAIVLGAAVHNSKPSSVFAERINHAVNLYHAGKVKKLIFTGATGEKDELAESVVARDYAISKNVSSNNIFIETRSVTTHQNLVYAKELLDREKLTTALIVSDSMHLKRAILISKRLNLKAKPSATPTSRYQSLKKKLPFALRELYFYHHYLLFSE